MKGMDTCMLEGCARWSLDSKEKCCIVTHGCTVVRNLLLGVRLWSPSRDLSLSLWPWWGRTNWFWTRHRDTAPVQLNLQTQACIVLHARRSLLWNSRPWSELISHLLRHCILSLSRTTFLLGLEKEAAATEESQALFPADSFHSSIPLAQLGDGTTTFTSTLTIFATSHFPCLHLILPPPLQHSVQEQYLTC